MNATPVLAAAVGAGPPGQPPPGASQASTADGQPFSSAMAQAIEQQSNGDAASMPLVTVVPSPAMGFATAVEARLSVEIASIEDTSTGPDRSAEVIEGESSLEDATEEVSILMPALVSWAAAPPPVPTAGVPLGVPLGVPGNDTATKGAHGVPVEAANELLGGDTDVPVSASSRTSEATPPTVPALEAAPARNEDGTRLEGPPAEPTSSAPGAPVTADTSSDLGQRRDEGLSTAANLEAAPSRDTPRERAGSSLPQADGLDASVVDRTFVSEPSGTPPTSAATPGIASAPAAPAPAATGVATAAFDVLDTTQPASMPPALADSVASAVRVGQDELRLVLNPPDLGQLDVRIVETSDGLRVSLHASTREASELIQQQLPALQAALETRDLRVERLEVRADLGGGLDQPGERGDRRGSPEAGQAPEWSSAASTDRASSGPSARGALGRPGGRLDLVA